MVDRWASGHFIIKYVMLGMNELGFNGLTAVYGSCRLDTSLSFNTELVFSGLLGFLLTVHCEAMAENHSLDVL